MWGDVCGDTVLVAMGTGTGGVSGVSLLAWLTSCSILLSIFWSKASCKEPVNQKKWENSKCETKILQRTMCNVKRCNDLIIFFI